MEEREQRPVWNAVTATDFDNEARDELIKALSENSTGNAKSLVSGYMSHLRRFRLFLSLDETVSKELESKNILSPNGKEYWYKGTIDSMLSNEKYVGDVELFKPDETTETYLMEDSHPAIIERATFHATQLEKKSRSNIVNTDAGRKRKNKKYSSKRK